jgi:hypothetical protein
MVCHSKINFLRKMTVLHKVQLKELSLGFIGFLSISHHFQFEVTFTLAHNALLCSLERKYVNPILKQTFLEG